MEFQPVLICPDCKTPLTTQDRAIYHCPKCHREFHKRGTYIDLVPHRRLATVAVMRPPPSTDDAPKRHSYLFIFSEALATTNLPVLELTALLRILWDYANVSIRFVPILGTHLLNSRQVNIRLFAHSAIVETLNELTLDDLVVLVRRASYIFSCGDLIVAEPWHQITISGLERDLLAHCRNKNVALPLYFYTRTIDSNARDFLEEIAIDDTRYFIEHSYFSREVVGIGNRFRGQCDTHNLPSSPGEAIFVIRDVGSDADQEPQTGLPKSTLYPDEQSTLFLLAYHSRVKSENPVHLLDEDKPYWAGTYSTPPRVMGAMYNIANVTDRDIVLEPFAGTGTAVIEGLKIGCKIIFGDLYEPRGVADNLTLLTNSDALLDCVNSVERIMNEEFPRELRAIEKLVADTLQRTEEGYVDLGKEVEELEVDCPQLQHLPQRILYYLVRRWTTERIIKGAEISSQAAIREWLAKLRRYGWLIKYSKEKNGVWLHDDFKDDAQRLPKQAQDDLRLSEDSFNTRRIGFLVHDHSASIGLRLDARRIPLPDESIDVIITDPPYGYATSMTEE